MVSLYRMPLIANRLLSQNTDRCCSFFIKKGARVGEENEKEDFKYFQKLIEFIAKEAPLNSVLSGKHL